MKQVWAFIFVFLLFSFLLVSAQSSLSGVEDIEKSVGVLDENVKQVQNQSFWSEKWEYLGKEWKPILLKYSGINAIDSLFTQISIVFIIFLGESYSFSIGFFFMVLLWIYLFFNLAYLSKAFFNKGLSFLISFFVILLLARFGFFLYITNLVARFFILLKSFIDFLPLAIFLIVIFVGLSFYFFESFFNKIVLWYKIRIKRLSDTQMRQEKALLHMLASKLISVMTGKTNLSG